MRNFYIERYTDKPDVDFIAYKDRSSEVEKEPAYKDSSHFEILKPATLVINNATEADEFVYQFVANVRSKEGTSKPKSSAWLKVYGKDSRLAFQSVWGWGLWQCATTGSRDSRARI